jgi:hypothetical protein
MLWIAADKSEPLCGAVALIVPPSVGTRYRRSRRDHSQLLASAAVPDLRASSACASANVRTIAAASAANAFGVAAVTEGFGGQTTMTKLGSLAVGVIRR